VTVKQSPAICISSEVLSNGIFRIWDSLTLAALPMVRSNWHRSECVNESAPRLALELFDRFFD
jgi:hypothetical protein